MPAREMTRRDLGWVLMKAAATAGGQEFFGPWLAAAQKASGHAHRGNSNAPPEPDRWTNYQPKFFGPEEFRIVDVFTAILIPTDETPGAREAHVAPFIDFVVGSAAEYAPEMQTDWRRARDWLRGQGFANLTPERQVALIEQMAEPERDRAKKHDGYRTYRTIKDLAVFAFYTSRVGLVEVLEYKGNAYLTEFPACTHPEHRRV
jgi:hypothetical protein